MSEKSMSKDTRKNVIRRDRSVCTGSGGTGGNGKSHLFVVTFTGNIAGV